ncbi:MAG: trypsin-like peptidase domain-containing protein [Armatimonadota bacterium]
MRSILLPILLLSSLATVVEAQSVGKRLQAVSVNVRARGAEGSGSLFVVDIEGKTTNWVLTAYHVVEGLRTVSSVVGPDGQERKRVTYYDAQILQEQVQDGRVVGTVTYDAKIVCVSARYDLAVLRVRKDGKIVEAGAKLYTGSDVPDVGTPILHAGSPGGADIGGSATLTSGIISRIGVRINDFTDSDAGIYDQVDCAALPGSSGGLVALASTGEIVGIITIGVRSADSFHWIVPARTILKWSEQAGIRWIFDSAVPPPKLADLEKIPLETDAVKQDEKPKSAGQSSENGLNFIQMHHD